MGTDSTQVNEMGCKSTKGLASLSLEKLFWDNVSQWLVINGMYYRLEGLPSPGLSLLEEVSESVHLIEMKMATFNSYVGVLIPSVQSKSGDMYEIYRTGIRRVHAQTRKARGYPPV